MTDPRTQDPYRLERFVRAQDHRGTFTQALAELGRGRKSSHWMWFVFPQVAGLGRSATAQEYAISSLTEAQAYLAHPVLGPRLRACSEIVANTVGRSAEQIFGGIDAMKLHSSMTLFRCAAPEERVFGDVLEGFFAGRPDASTEDLVRRAR